MNSFGENRIVHIPWSVILAMYNIPIWLYRKRNYLMLFVLIQGPTKDGINIDVFLEPLMQDMVKLWSEGERMWDQY
jgi:hypothetical protein